jgi:hypothetical protein
MTITTMIANPRTKTTTYQCKEKLRPRSNLYTHASLSEEKGNSSKCSICQTPVTSPLKRVILRPTTSEDLLSQEQLGHPSFGRFFMVVPCNTSRVFDSASVSASVVGGACFVTKGRDMRDVTAESMDHVCMFRLCTVSIRDCVTDGVGEKYDLPQSDPPCSIHPQSLCHPQCLLLASQQGTQY